MALFIEVYDVFSSCRNPQNHLIFGGFGKEIYPVLL